MKKQLTIFDFLEPEPTPTPTPIPKDKDVIWCKANNIHICEKIELSSTVEFSKATPYLNEFVIKAFESIGIIRKQKISYALFNRLCISLDLGFREGHRDAKQNNRDFKIVTKFDDGSKIIKFKSRTLGLYCTKNQNILGEIR